MPLGAFLLREWLVFTFWLVAPMASAATSSTGRRGGFRGRRGRLSPAPPRHVLDDLLLGDHSQLRDVVARLERVLAQDGRLVRVVAGPARRRVRVVALERLEEGRRGDGAEARGGGAPAGEAAPADAGLGYSGPPWTQRPHISRTRRLQRMCDGCYEDDHRGSPRRGHRRLVAVSSWNCEFAQSSCSVVLLELRVCSPSTVLVATVDSCNAVSYTHLTLPTKA